MISQSDSISAYTATYRGSVHESFYLADHLGNEPVVFAVFPGTATLPCTNEMVVLSERIDECRAPGTTLYGISTDSLFAQGAFADEHGLQFDFVSDMVGDAIGADDLVLDPRTCTCTASPTGPSTSTPGGQ